MFYLPVVTLSTQDDNKILQQLKTRFQKTINWNTYRSKMSKQTKNINLNYLIDASFNKANSLFVLSFKNEDDRISYEKFFMPTVEMC